MVYNVPKKQLKKAVNIVSTKLNKSSGDDDPLQRYTFGSPYDFQMENHIGWDAKNMCLDYSKLSKEIKQIFKNAGIRKRDLKN